MDEENSYIARLQSCYNKLRKSRLVKNCPTVLDDEALEHFTGILNSALPVTPEERSVEQAVKLMYFWNPYGFVRGLHKSGRGNNSRRDARCMILLTIGLEIVKEFGLSKVIHLKWNKETHEYELNLLLDPENPPDPETFRKEQQTKERSKAPRRKDRVQQMAHDMAALRKQVATLQNAPKTNTDTASWADIADNTDHLVSL